ncbi:uncharacterized protein N0V89_012514 [Didymosphaeria variabile]|uniref:Uncharacterized protein n=1 Tax=Didymosphaeria variabile TaxID=1932322 RepID=A0A9W8XAT0_9PLEO|nr:uncharacterized protein N0V89_012514 [Didymosphaeria variabile]KAJ4344770.1 hypothetical protein N0V89_012514 [Didymosphaeria variabile]
MSSPPADPSPSASAQKNPMSWSAVVKKASSTKGQPSADKTTSAKTPASTTEKPTPAGKPSPVNANRARMLPSYATAHLSPVIGSIGSRLGEARVGPPPAASSAPFHAGGVAPSASFYPAAPNTYPGFYQPPQEPTEAQSSGKVTKPFAKEAGGHSNAERWVRTERAAASARAAAMTPQASVPAVSASVSGPLAGGSRSSINAAVDPNATLPAYGDGGPSAVRRSTTSGNAITPAVPNFVLGGSRTIDAHKRASSGPSGPSVAIGSERESGALILSDVPQRRLIALTLSLVRSAIAKQIRTDNKYEAFKEFLDRVCPIGGGVPELDEWIPSIAFAYWYPMTDHDWMIYGHVVGHFKLSEEADNVLGSVTAAGFDRVNTTFDSAILFPLRGPVDQLMRDLAVRFNLNKPYDVNKEKKDRNSDPC